MKYKAVTPRQDEVTRDSEPCKKPFQCVIYPVNSDMVAEDVERINKNWIVWTKATKDLIVQVGDYSFHLHKLPMVSRSGYLNRLVFERRNGSEKGSNQKIRLENFPGGSDTFELVAKFCYRWRIDVTAENIAPLHCAAHFLEMSDDLESGNLISKTEAFISYVIFSSWKGTFQILKSCESLSFWAKELQILKQCSNAIAWEVCTEPKASAFGDTGKVEDMAENWWFEDVSALRIDHFIEVIESIKRRGMKSELVGSCIELWTSRWLSRVNNELENEIPSHLSQQLQRVTVESLIRVLPAEENLVSCNFLLQLLKLGLLKKINLELLNQIEKRIVSMLEQCQVQDLLVKNDVDDDTTYDVRIVIRVVEWYAMLAIKHPAPRIHAVGRLLDGYLTLIAQDKYLTVNNFQSLAEALPKGARFCDNNLYRAIDMYLKAHPLLEEEDRTSVCRAMDYNKLSQEARQHVMKNKRLPLQITTQAMLLEQGNSTRSTTGFGSNYQRTKAQTIIRVSNGLEKEQMTSMKEIKMIRKEVETMKMQLNKLQMCKMKIQKQMGKCIK
ncbi:hypothetical protein SLA2020_293110 [Shorea laevis]